MKIAVCFSGLYRKNISINPHYLHANYEKAFPDADFFYHTWDEYITDIPVIYHDALFSCPEPFLDYHPVFDVSVSSPHPKFPEYKKGNIPDTKKTKLLRQTKQMLGHADLLSKIPQDYDVIVRARYDVNIWDVNYDKFLNMAAEGTPVGFATKLKQGQQFGKLHEATKEDEETCLGHLPDYMIIHNPKKFDSDYVFRLHREQNLLPGEWGWWQVLSEPYGDNHRVFCGYAQIVR